jgi:glycopeptide antibiotics resistance protein
MIVSVPFIVLFRAIAIAGFKKKGMKLNWYHEIGVLVFLLVTVGIASQTAIPKLQFGGSNFIINGNLSGGINLIPGMVFIDTYRECIENGYLMYFIINFIGNICLFAPLGFLIPLMWNKITLKKTALIALSASLLIELAQLPQARGTDIDDLWINLLGAVIGYAVYTLLNKPLCHFFENFKMELT